MIFFIKSKYGVVDFKEQFNGEDIFAVVEAKLYKKYPKYLETNNYFLQNGNRISRFKTIKENEIGNNIPILMAISQEKSQYNNSTTTNNKENYDLINNNNQMNNNNMMMNKIVNNNMQINNGNI